MKKYEIKGVDKDSGTDELVIIDAVDRDSALSAAYERGLAVSDITELKNLKPRKTRSNRTPSANDESGFDQHWGRAGGLRGSLNRVAENALGTFLGLVAFSLISPIIIIFVLVVLAYFGQNLSTSA